MPCSAPRCSLACPMCTRGTRRRWHGANHAYLTPVGGFSVQGEALGVSLGSSGKGMQESVDLSLENKHSQSRALLCSTLITAHFIRETSYCIRQPLGATLCGGSSQDLVYGAKSLSCSSLILWCNILCKPLPSEWTL